MNGWQFHPGCGCFTEGNPSPYITGNYPSFPPSSKCPLMLYLGMTGSEYVKEGDDDDDDEVE